MVIGLSHSEIRGLMVICTYPQLIAAYHVLHRLCEPRHPPFALTYFHYDLILSYYLFLHTKKGTKKKNMTNPLILSAVIDSSWNWFNFYMKSFLQFCLFQYVKDLFYFSCSHKEQEEVMWRITDSNRWPPACKAGALASWANPPKRLLRGNVVITHGIVTGRLTFMPAHIALNGEV